MNFGPMSDRHDQRDEAGDEDAGHCASAPTSASATTSSPTAREALHEHRVARGDDGSRTSSIARAASGAHSSGP